MADEQTKVTDATKPEDNQNPEGNGAEDKKNKEELNAKELNDKLQEALTELAKLKREKDKASAEAKDYKDKYRESLSATEKASMEKAEAEAKREEQFQQLMRENTMNKIEKQYLAMGWTAEEAEKMATAEVDNDFDAKVKIMAEVDARKKKTYEAEFIASRPDVNIGAGNGQTYTKEQFDKLDPIQLTKLKRENEAEYNRLMAL